MWAALQTVRQATQLHRLDLAVNSGRASTETLSDNNSWQEKEAVNDAAAAQDTVSFRGDLGGARGMYVFRSTLPVSSSDDI
jgi:hypothetical protein